MKRTVLVLLLFASGLVSACATITAPGFAGNNEVTLSAAAAKTDGSVQNLADQYVNHLQDQGWLGDESSKHAGKLMGLLSRGISALGNDKPDDPYADYVHKASERLHVTDIASILLADITDATQATRILHQQVNAISHGKQFYGLDTPDARALERAVISAHKARRYFVSVAQHYNALSPELETALSALDTKITSLGQQASALEPQETNQAVG